MTPDQIAALAASGESETLEFKATSGTRREATMTVCAFLNQRGGQVLFGVTQDGAGAGQQVSERLAVFGSALREDFGPDRIPGLLGVAGMEIELSELFGGWKVDLRTPEDIS